VKPARQYQPQGSATVGLLAFWHPQPATTHVESCDEPRLIFFSFLIPQFSMLYHTGFPPFVGTVRRTCVRRTCLP